MVQQHHLPVQKVAVFGLWEQSLIPRCPHTCILSQIIHLRRVVYAFIWTSICLINYCLWLMHELHISSLVKPL